MTVPAASLPDAFVERVRRIVPAERFDEVLGSFFHDKPTSFRVNTLKAEVSAVQQELVAQGFVLTPLESLPGGFWVEASQRRALTESAAVAEGRVYIQGVSSMLAPLALAPQPGEEVLDLAAAPGGKTLQMAALMGNQGRIAAVEPIRGRFYRLEANLRLHGATIVKTYLADGRSIGRKTPLRFDRVLLDAPCSGEARFDVRDPSTWDHWGIRKIKEQARKQFGLIRSAVASLKQGGRLVYCTCSLAPEENERVIHGLLEELGDEVGVVPWEVPFGRTQPGLTEWEGESYRPDLARTLRVLPGPAMDALYLAILERLRTPRALNRRVSHRRHG